MCINLFQTYFKHTKKSEFINMLNILYSIFEMQKKPPNIKMQIQIKAHNHNVEAKYIFQIKFYNNSFR